MRPDDWRPRRTALLPALLVLLGANIPGGPAFASDTLLTCKGDGVILEYSSRDSTVAPALLRLVEEGSKQVGSFFGSPFSESIFVRLFPDRPSMEEFWRAAWKMPDLKSECWQVASGTASALSVLSPRVWQQEACEHDRADTAAFRRLILHELVHVYHARRNPAKEFEGLDDLGWFIEGLATYLSGQLEASHAEDARAAIRAGKAPKELKTAWSGRYRYGVCGSIVKYIDKEYGRKVVGTLLQETENRAVLKLLGTTETEFLARWRTWVGKR
jgi:hypothetical protein